MSDAKRHIQLMDTTLRDGEQTRGVSFTPDEKINIAKALLQKLGVDRIEIASATVSAGEKAAVTSINRWAAEEGYQSQVEILGFVDHKRSVDWIRDTEGQVINLLTKGSELHCRRQLNKTLDEHLSDIHRTIEYALASSLNVNVYLEDWSNGYKNSPEYVFKLMDALDNTGVGHFLLPDTLGVMGSDEVFTAMKDMLERYPGTHFDFHPHNDYGLATANVMAAVRAGINSIHCTINCLGERAGNASLAEVSVVLKDKMGMEVSINEQHINDLSRMVETFSGKWVSTNTPIVGQDVFTQTAGIHADGDQKGGLYESELRPTRFDRKRSYALGKMSGKASLQKNLEALDLSLTEDAQKKVLKRIVELGDLKQTITLDDLPFIIADVMESNDYQHIKLLDCSISSSLDMESTVSIQVEMEDGVHEATGSGNGGFDAFINSINQIMEKKNYTLPKLQDYEIRIPKGGETNALTECIITWQTQGKNLRTRGVHVNQVYAAVQAALKVINLQLHERKTGLVN